MAGEDELPNAPSAAKGSDDPVAAGWGDEAFGGLRIDCEDGCGVAVWDTGGEVNDEKAEYDGGSPWGGGLAPVLAWERDASRFGVLDPNIGEKLVTCRKINGWRRLAPLNYQTTGIMARHTRITGSRSQSYTAALAVTVDRVA